MAATVVMVCLFAGGVSLHAQAPPEARQVLLLESSERGSAVFDRFTEAFRSEVESRLGRPVTFTQFVVAPAGVEEPNDTAIIAYLHSLYANRQHPDLVVSIGGPAAAFARLHRDEVFPESPLIYGAVEQRYLGDAPLRGNEAAVTVLLDHARLVDEILEFFPDTSNLFVLVAAGPAGQYWRGRLEQELQRFAHVRVSFDSDLSYGEMLQRTATLPPHSAILMVTSGTDARGGWHGAERTIGDVTARANAPLFSIQGGLLGLGVIGGRLIDNKGLGGVAADAAVRVLNGEPPADIRIPVNTVGPARFDARQLRRWGIGENRLPADSEVLFRPPSLWRDYRREAIGALAALLLQSGLIAGLLYQRRARRRAEIQSRNNLVLAADANRRLTMTALTGSIAHELSQPLNSILHNAQAGELLVASSRATPEALAEILTDIRTADLRASQIIERHRTMLRNRQVEMKPLDLHGVVRESLALLAHDIKARHVVVDVRLPADACMVAGDKVLLQQVFVNLIINAMDATAGADTSERRIAIDQQHSAKEACVTVTDNGTGLPAAMIKDLFEPFVTTKTHGIGVGLTIARTIVEAHRGRLTAANNPEGGASFALVLPREMPRP